MSVDTQHKEYSEMIDEWRIVRACSRGQREVKALGIKILPAPGEVDGVYDKTRYNAYRSRAIYTNITGRTKSGLVGAAFRKEPEIDLPGELEYLEDNADGGGQSITQLSKDVLSNLIETGREILLVDYPTVDEGLTLEEIKLIDPKAYIKRYSAEDAINWSVSNSGGASILSMIVLREMYNNSDDEFVVDMNEQFRVLRLRDDGYTQQVYRDGEPIQEEFYPKQANGSRFDFIPCFVAGSQNNDPSVDYIPLSDIAHVNIGHYRNSADQEESAYIAGQSMLHIDIGDMDAEQWTTLNGGKIELGSRRAIQTVKGKAELVQAEPRSVFSEMMEAKEGQMLALGAKLVEKRNPNETAAAAKIDATGENSVLGDLVGNVEEAMRTCIEWCGLFMGSTQEPIFDMNREFFPDSVDPQLIMASIQLNDRGVIGKTDLRGTARKAGLIDESRTDEDIDNEVTLEDPIGKMPLNSQNQLDREQ